MTKPDHQLPKTRSGEPRAFFGRRSGKKLHGGQQAVFDATLPDLEIKLSGRLDPASLFPPTIASPGRDPGVFRRVCRADSDPRIKSAGSAGGEWLSCPIIRRVYRALQP